jgi:Protein of unknown function (DUF1569)
VTEIETAIAENRKGVDEFIEAARAVPPARWQTPRAKGAWSPAQIVEHLAVTYEFNRRVVAGTAPPLPLLLRYVLAPLLRRWVITNTLEAGRFTRKGRTPKFLMPSATPPDVDTVIARLNVAVTGLEGDLRSRHPEARHTVAHPAFGTIATHDWMRVQAIHARHHRDQLTST